MGWLNNNPIFLEKIIPATDLDTWLYNKKSLGFFLPQTADQLGSPFFQNNGLLKLARFDPSKLHREKPTIPGGLTPRNLNPLRLGVFVLLIIGLLLWCSKGRSFVVGFGVVGFRGSFVARPLLFGKWVLLRVFRVVLGCRLNWFS